METIGRAAALDNIGLGFRVRMYDHLMFCTGCGTRQAADRTPPEDSTQHGPRNYLDLAHMEFKD